MSEGVRNRKPEPKSLKSVPSSSAPVSATRPSRRRWYYLAALLALLLLGPFAIPDPHSPFDRSERDLADSDSKFIDLLGYTIHYKERAFNAPTAGEKTAPLTFILLHGFSSNVYSFRKLMDPLAKMGRVIAFDRIGQGLSAHPTSGDWPEGSKSPYAPSMQPKFIFALMDKLNIEKAVLIGNSNGGGQALRAALENPDRVLGVVSASSDWYTTGIMPSGKYSWLWNTPHMRRVGTWLSAKLLGPSNAESTLPFASSSVLLRKLTFFQRFRSY
jgi:pimeloyl-ACP methyl ester carboxylesterase